MNTSIRAIFFATPRCCLCACGRPVASYPSLLRVLFGGKPAADQYFASTSHRCLGCYVIGKYIKEVRS